MYQPGVLTEAECLSQCAANNRCVGLDWAPQTTLQCWFHLDNIGPIRNTAGVTYFVLRDRCPGGNCHVLEIKIKLM